MNDIFIGVMDINEARTHQERLKNSGVLIEFKTNGHTCTTGCKVTVEVWGREEDSEKIAAYLNDDYLKHVRGHELNLEALSQVFDPAKESAVCQACGMKFSPLLNECPDCGLYYGQ